MLEWEYSSHVISGLHEQRFSGIREPKHSSYGPKSDVVVLHVIHEVTRATPLVVQVPWHVIIHVLATKLTSLTTLN